MGSTGSKPMDEELRGFCSHELINQLREDRHLYECCRIHPELRRHVLREAKRLYKKPKECEPFYIDYQLNSELYSIIKDFQDAEKHYRREHENCIIL